MTPLDPSTPQPSGRDQMEIAKPKRDMRTKAERDDEIFDRIAREGGFSLSWLVSNRDHAASMHRLIAAGRVNLGLDWLYAQLDSEPSGETKAVTNISLGQPASGETKPETPSWRENLRAFVERIGL